MNKIKNLHMNNYKKRINNYNNKFKKQQCN